MQPSLTPAEQQRQETREKATRLLEAIWESIPSQYRQTRRFHIWEEFQHAAATHCQITSRLPEFISNLCGRFNGTLTRLKPEQQAFVLTLEHSPEIEQRQILQVYRAELAGCIVQVQVWNQEKRLLRQEVPEEEEDEPGEEETLA